MREALFRTYRNLTDREKDTIASIYKHRCLTLEQIYRLHFAENAKNSNYCRTRINQLEKDGIITKEITNLFEVYFLTTDGVDMATYILGLSNNVLDINNQILKRGYFRASELRIIPRNINHQVFLNEFYTDFKEAVGNKIDYKYYDEKYITHFGEIRPDGLIEMAGVDFFIETDMATESRSQMLEKWENYRRFLSNRDYVYRDKKIVVLFAIENTKVPETRIDVIKNTIYNRILDLVDEKFEIYIDTRERLISLLVNKVAYLKKEIKEPLDDAKKIYEKNGFSFVAGYNIAQFLGGITYDYYLRKLDKKNSVKVEGGKVQEFVMDSYHYRPFSVLKKIQYLRQSNISYREAVKRNITYVILVDDLEEIYHDLRVINLIYIENLCFTTLERLEKYGPWQGLVTIDALGNISRFQDKGLKETVYEYNLVEEQLKR